MLCFTPWCKCVTYEHTGGCFRCRSQHEDLDLVDVETFYQEAPKDISCPVCSCLQIQQYALLYVVIYCIESGHSDIVLVVLSVKLHHLYFLPNTRAWLVTPSYRMCIILIFFRSFLIHRTTGGPLRRLNVVFKHGPMIPC